METWPARTDLIPRSRTVLAVRGQKKGGRGEGKGEEEVFLIMLDCIFSLTQTFLAVLSDP